MAQIKSLKDLESLKISVQEQIDTRIKGDKDGLVQVKVAMATCGIAAGDKGVSTMVDIQKHTLGTFQKNAFARFIGLIDGNRGVGHIRCQVVDRNKHFFPCLVHIQKFRAMSRIKFVVFGGFGTEQCFKTFFVQFNKFVCNPFF